MNEEELEKEIDRHLVVNRLSDGLYELRIWNEAGTECPRRGKFGSERAAMRYGRRKLSYLKHINKVATRG